MSEKLNGRTLNQEVGKTRCLCELHLPSRRLELIQSLGIGVTLMIWPTATFFGDQVNFQPQTTSFFKVCNSSLMTSLA
jgi:hypothetical protein